MEDECVGSGGDRGVSGAGSSGSGREDWPGRQSQGRCTPGEGRGHQALGWAGGKTLSWWKKGKSVFQRNLISPALLGPLVVGLFMVQEQDQQWNFS